MTHVRPPAGRPLCIARLCPLLPRPVPVAWHTDTPQHMQPMVIGRADVIHLS